MTSYLEKYLKIRVISNRALHDSFIHWDICNQPFVIDVIETTFYISFYNPLGRTFSCQNAEDLFPCIFGAPSFAKAEGNGIGGCFSDGLKRKGI